MPPKTYVGLLITPTSIEAAQCSKNEAGEISFDFYHHMAMADSVVDEEGDITNAEALGKALAEFWKENDIKTKNVVLGLSGKRAIARLVSLPRIPANQLQQVILSEAEQYTLFRDEEPFVDYFTVDADTETSTVFWSRLTMRSPVVMTDWAWPFERRTIAWMRATSSSLWKGLVR